MQKFVGSHCLLLVAKLTLLIYSQRHHGAALLPHRPVAATHAFRTLSLTTLLSPPHYHGAVLLPRRPAAATHAVRTLSLTSLPLSASLLLYFPLLLSFVSRMAGQELRNPAIPNPQARTPNASHSTDSPRLMDMAAAVERSGTAALFRTANGSCCACKTLRSDWLSAESSQ